MSAAALVARLAQEGVDPTLLSEIAQELFAGESERKALADRRKNERDRKADQRLRSRDVTGRSGTKRDSLGQPSDGFPKESNQTPSLPPAEVSEPSGSSPQPRLWTLPLGVNLQVWTDFLGNRKRKRLGNTPTAWKAFLDDLTRVASQTGIPPPKLIEHAAAKGWGSINTPDEDQGHGRTNGMGRNQSSDGLSPTTRAALSVFGAPGTGDQQRVPQ